MNSIAKTFSAFALGAVVAGGGTAYYYEDQNNKREAAELAEANSINPNYSKSWNELGVYHTYFSCYKETRQGVLTYKPELIEVEHEGRRLKKAADLDQTPRVVLTDGFSTVFEGEISFDQTVAAITTLEKFCHTGEFEAPTPE